MSKRRRYIRPLLQLVPLVGESSLLKSSQGIFIPVDPGGEYGGEFDVKEQDPYHYDIWDEEW